MSTHVHQIGINGPLAADRVQSVNPSSVFKKKYQFPKPFLVAGP